MGLLDQLKAAILSGSEMYGSASQPAPPEVVKGLLGFAPVAGDAISAYDAYDAAKQGNYGEAALNAAGLLPFVPSLGNVIKHIPAPDWNAARKTIPVGVNPTRDERMQLFKDSQSKQAEGLGLRLLKDQSTGTYYAWPIDAALHQDVGAHFGLDPNVTKHLYDLL